MPDPTPKRKRNKYNVPAEKFVLIWNEGKCVREIAAATGMPKKIASAWASQLRGRGVDLKKFTGREEKRLDVDKLNKLIGDAKRKKKKR